MRRNKHRLAHPHPHIHRPYGAASAVAGDESTRRRSSVDEPEWIAVVLQRPISRLCSVRLLWEASYAEEFLVQLSRDGSHWLTAERSSAPGPGWQQILFPRGAIATDDLGAGALAAGPDSGAAALFQHLRILCTRRATRWSFSLYELQVYGYSADASERAAAASAAAACSGATGCTETSR